MIVYGQGKEGEVTFSLQKYCLSYRLMYADLQCNPMHVYSVAFNNLWIIITLELQSWMGLYGPWSPAPLKEAQWEIELPTSDRSCTNTKHVGGANDWDHSIISLLIFYFLPSFELGWWHSSQHLHFSNIPLGRAMVWYAWQSTFGI